MEQFGMLWDICIASQPLAVEQTSLIVIANGRNTPWSGVTKDESGAVGIASLDSDTQSHSCHDPRCARHDHCGNSVLSGTHSPERNDPAWAQWEPWSLRFSRTTLSNEESTVFDTGKNAIVHDHGISSSKVTRSSSSPPHTSLDYNNSTMADNAPPVAPAAAADAAPAAPAAPAADAAAAAVPAAAAGAAVPPGLRPMLPVLTNEQRLVPVRAVYNPTGHTKIQLAKIGTEVDVMGNAHGDLFCFVSRNNIFLTDFFSYMTIDKRDEAIANNGVVQTTDRIRFIRLVNEWNENSSRRLRFPVHLLSVRGERYASTFFGHETTGEDGNRVIRGTMRYFLSIRIGHIGHNGDGLQAGIHAVKLDLTDRTADTQSPPEEGAWTQFFVRVLDGALRANNLAGIEMGNDAAEDMALMNGVRRDNSRRVRKDGKWIKVDSRNHVINRYIAYLRREFADLNNINVVEPDSDDEDDQLPHPPLVQLRSLDYDI